jgi:hypothetical protein
MTCGGGLIFNKFNALRVTRMQGAAGHGIANKNGHTKGIASNSSIDRFIF